MNLSPRLSALFGAGAVAAEFTGPGDPSALFPQEAEACRGFAAKRVAEFAAGRLCARRALAEFGVDDFPLLPKPDRSPRWPDGIVGSITHTGDFCAAVVARSSRFAGIGIDAEIVGRVTPELWAYLFTDGEAALLRAVPAPERIATVIFSAKEAFYKCQFTLTERWVGFRDVSVTVEDDGTFIVRLARDHPSIGALLPATGRYQIDGDLVLTGVAIVPAGA